MQTQQTWLAGGWRPMVVALVAVLQNYGHYVFEYFPVLSVGRSLLISLLSGSLIAILAAIGPAYMAARKQPVDALRVEE